MVVILTWRCDVGNKLNEDLSMSEKLAGRENMYFG